MPAIKTAISLEQNLSLRAVVAREDYLRRQENIALLERINASCDDAPDPNEEKHLKAAQRSFRKTLDEW